VLKGGGMGGAAGLGAVGLNALLSVAAFCLFSPLCGSPHEVVVGLVVVILGLSASRLLELVPWLGWPVLLLPPFEENVRASAGVFPPVMRSLACALLLLGAGLARFRRREYYWD